MRRVALLVAIVSCASEEPMSVEARCEKVLDRWIELELAETKDIDREAHAKAKRAAFGADFVAGCATKLTEAQRDCLLAATSSAAASVCSNP
jgi:hypothetical protein